MNLFFNFHIITNFLLIIYFSLINLITLFLFAFYLKLNIFYLKIQNYNVIKLSFSFFIIFALIMQFLIIFFMKIFFIIKIYFNLFKKYFPTLKLISFYFTSILFFTDFLLCPVMLKFYSKSLLNI